MDRELAMGIVDAVAEDLSKISFKERHDSVTDDIVGLVKKPWSLLRRVFGGHGISAVVAVPELVSDRAGLKAFFQSVRKDINSWFVGFAAYKSSHSFIVLVCPHGLFEVCPGIASELRDRTGLHTNLMQGVILVDSETREATGDCTRPTQHRREYEAVLAAVRRVLSQEGSLPNMPNASDG